MKILSWNYRGFRKTMAVQRCRRLVSLHFPDFVFLAETRLPANVAFSNLNNLGFDFYVGTDAIRKGGGTMVAWKKSYVVKVVELAPYVCHCEVSSNDMSIAYYLSFVYGPPNYTTHPFFLQWIQAKSASISNQWLLIGDFNVILSREDKLGHTGSSSSQNQFANCITSSNLIELPPKGCHFTWTNNRKDGELILEKLDRNFCNSSWLSSFPFFNYQTLGIVASDHCPSSPNQISLFSTLDRNVLRNFGFNSQNVMQ